ncbi:MAG: RNA polymerase sigma factor [Proteobacteria bacterium]|nr:RNA polymerase sigma factor [Pseudomonadota bacterium]
MAPQPPQSAAIDPAAPDRESLRHLADQFGTVLRQFFMRRVHEREEVDDLVQEVYIRLLKRGRVEEVEDLRGYLFETAASVVTDRARKRRSHRTEVHESFDPAEHSREEFSADRVLIGEETLTRASRALLELPERARTIFILRRLEGLRYQDIAQRLGISLSLVEKQMAKAVAYLNQRMNDE